MPAGPWRIRPTTQPDVAPNEWVYNHPFFLILNMAIGGNFGGTIDPNIPFPQTMAVDYVRVYQAENTSERFEAQFVDDFTGWQQITIPFADLTRSAVQPEGAPNDGLTLTEVWGYGFQFESGTSGQFKLDRVYVETAVPDIAPGTVSLDGATTGVVNTTYTFTATVSPATATTPLTFTWAVDGETPVVHIVNGLEDALNLDWAVAGSHTITVTAANDAGSATSTHVITIEETAVAPTNVSLIGADTGVVGTTYAFTATVVPTTTTTPLTYTWTVNDGIPVVHTTTDLQDVINLDWTVAGSYTITVTAANDAGAATSTHVITIDEVLAAPLSVSLTGAMTGVVSTTYAFTATVAPTTTTTPLTYTWMVDSNAPVVHTVNGLQDAISLAWTAVGTHIITVTVTNEAGSTTSTHMITINEIAEPQYTLFLPAIFKPQP
jgi:hypothetical protein